MSHWALSRLIIAWSSPWLGSVCPVTDFACLTQNGHNHQGRWSWASFQDLQLQPLSAGGAVGTFSSLWREAFTLGLWKEWQAGKLQMGVFQVVTPALLGSTAAAEHDKGQVLQACNVSCWHATTRLMQQTNQKQICPRSFRSNVKNQFSLYGIPFSPHHVIVGRHGGGFPFLKEARNP